ncbi:MAG: proteasome subunit alpha [Armatimonadota bacterium]
MMTPLAKPFSELVAGSLITGKVQHDVETHGTTVLALRFKEGIVVFADRRATIGNLIMFEQAEKIMPLDDLTVVAISGSFARSIEICRYLKHSYKYYRRAVLQELTLEGKLSEISRALAGNVEMAMNGIGVFIPIVAAYDKTNDKFGVYFFDGAGARFENGEYACAGSGSERIRGVFEFLRRTEGSFEDRSLDQVVENGLQMLDIASTLDSATGGFTRINPIVRVLTKDGNKALDENDLKKAVDKVLKAAKPL